MKQRKGMTLIELIIVLPLISIILMITYNMLFLSSKSFKYANDTFMTGEDIRAFTRGIQKEAQQAKKATDKKDGVNEIDGLHMPLKQDNPTLYIYADLDGDNKPELIRYQLVNHQIMRAVEKAKKIKVGEEPKFPYHYDERFNGEQVVLRNVINNDIFGDIEKIVANNGFVDLNDYRRRVTMKIEISTGEGSSPIVIHTILANKSRTQFDE